MTACLSSYAVLEGSFICRQYTARQLTRLWSRASIYQAHLSLRTQCFYPSLLAAVHTLIIISMQHAPFTSDPCCHDTQLKTPGVTCTVMSCLCGLASLWWVYLCVCVCADNIPDLECLCVMKVVLIFDCQLKYFDLSRESPTPNLSITIRTAPRHP